MAALEPGEAYEGVNALAESRVSKLPQSAAPTIIVQQPKSSGLSVSAGLLTSVCALAIVGYLGACIYNGQLAAMFAQLATDWHFLEFLAALGVLYLAARSEYLSGPATALIAVAAVAFALKTFANPKVAATVTPAVDSFAAGKTTLFPALANIFGNIGNALGLKATAATTGPATATGNASGNAPTQY